MSKGRIGVRKQETVASTLPEVGKIKIGEKAISKNGKEYPTSLDYFRATGSFAPAFTQTYGDKPNRLSVAFISDNLEEVCNERYEAWDRGKRFGYGDGETFTVWDADQKQYVGGLKATDPAVKKLKWEVILTLRFVLLEMKGIMGYWSFSTKGKLTTIPSVVKAFDYVRERANTIIGFPFNLLVEKKSGYSPGDPRTYPVVTLVPNFSEEAIEMIKDYITSGGKVNEITTRMITQEKVLQIENKTIQNGNENSKETSEETGS